MPYTISNRLTRAIALSSLALAALGQGETSAGCGKDPSLSSGQQSTNVNGIQRDYILKIPDNYDSSNPYKLIFGFHWLGGDMNAVVGNGYYGMEALSEGSAIFVAPNGIDNGWANLGGQDVTFTDQMLDAITNDLCVDMGQIFSAGWSYGGAMSYSLACSRSDVFRAVGVLSGAELSGCDGGTQPVAYYGQHGTFDSVLNYNMGIQLLNTFVQNNGCDQQTPQMPNNGSPHITTEFLNCNEEYPVIFNAFAGDHEPLPTDPGQDSSFTPGELWGFFSQFS